MFFVISGFLITTLLLNEIQRSGGISLRSFYVRRTLRIWPAFFTFIAFTYTIYSLGYLKLNPGDLFHSVTFTMNYHHDDAWVLSHLWSLSVEEQFYMLWPFILAYLGAQRGFHWAVVVMLIAPLIRAAMWYGWGVDDVAAMTREFQAVADSLAIGCILSCTYNAMTSHQRINAFICSRWSVALALVTLVSSFASHFVAPSLFYVFTQSLANIALAMLIVYAINAKGTLGTLLNSAPFTAIGLLSYSLYLWQNLFMNPDSNHWFTRFPTNLGLTFAAATASYFLVEKPFQSLKQRFTAKGRTDRKLGATS
jgi:peptidoglycan/LPS O-acetylase OafA/YrhL